MAEFIGAPILVLALANPDAPVLEGRGTPGTTHYGYKVVGLREGDHTAASPEAVLTTGPLDLSIVNSILITPPLDPHVVFWDVYRVRGGATQGRIGQVVPIIVDDVQQATLLDYGLVGDGEAAPAHNTSGQLYVADVTEGALFYAGSDGQVLPLAPGLDGHFLTLINQLPAWATGAGSLVNPMSSAGQIIVGGLGGVPAALSPGSTGQLLTISGGLPVWATPAPPGMTNPMTTLGDIIVGGALGVPQRLGHGTNGQLLTVVAGLPAWADAPGGGGGGMAIGAPVSGGTATDLLFVDVAHNLAQDNALQWDTTFKSVRIGGRFVNDLTVGSGAPGLILSGDDSATFAYLSAMEANHGTALMRFFTLGGTLATPLVSAAGDSALNLICEAMDTHPQSTRYAEVDFEVDTAPGSGIVTGRQRYYTADSTGTLRERFRMTSVGTTDMVTPNVQSTNVLSGQVELQSSLAWGLLSNAPFELLSPGSSVTYATLPGGYVGTPGLALVNDDGQMRGLDLTSLGNAYVAFNTLNLGFTATAADNTVVLDADLGQIEWNGFAATAGVVLNEAASIHALVDATPNATNHWVPGRLELRTSDATGVPQVALTLDHTQRAIFRAGVTMGALPTSDPHVVGQLWNSGGVVHVSAG